MSSTRRATFPPRFHVGDWVSFPYGAQTAEAQIIEDRGPLGVRGGRIYRVRLEIPHAEPTTFEVREEDLSAAAGTDSKDQ